MSSEISPFAGIGSLKFGQKESQVIQQIGKPSRIVDSQGPTLTRRLDYATKGKSCYLRESTGLFLIVATKNEEALTLFGKDVFSPDTVTRLEQEGIAIENETDGFGVLTRRAPDLGLEFCFEEGELIAVHCYDLESWRAYRSGRFSKG